MSPADVDLAAAVEHGRGVGGPALRELTFHQRASILRNVGKLLLSDDAKEPLYELSYCTGATRADSRIDIDGGAGVLLSYAGQARRELPNSTVAVDGPVEALSRDDSFSAVHILTPRTGVELQDQRLQLPGVGNAREARARLHRRRSLHRQARLADGVPGRGCREAHHRVRPDARGRAATGCASPGELDGLLDRLGGQDSIAFTGSAATAAGLRAHPAVTERAARLTVEADSLNAAVLAPAAAGGTAEFDLFCAEVVKEMTVKAGQRCTAIRRAIVPVEHLDAATEALAAALAEVVVGDPRDEATTMGPLVGLAQRDEVAASVAALREAAEPAFGSNEDAGAGSGGFKAPGSGSVGPSARGGAAHGVGAFMTPTLLRANDPAGPAVHTVEAFGPVCTLVPYRTLDEAVDLVAAGRGSLVASLYGADRDEIAALATGVASHHGRVLIVDSSMAAASTGHGSPLPPLVHGGPGRAGGGQELGGMRGVHDHMQRTAVQGSPDMLTAVTGEHIAGAATREHKGHPFKLTFDDLEVGDSITTESRTVTRADIAAFAESTGDKFYAHMDDEAAARSPIFNGLVAHGYLVLSFAAGLFVWPDEGPVLANYGIDRLRFAKPTYPDDEIHVVLTCKRKTSSTVAATARWPGTLG